MRPQRLQISKAILKKIKVRGITIPDFNYKQSYNNQTACIGIKTNIEIIETKQRAQK